MAFMGKIFQALRRTRETVSDAFETVAKGKVSVESLEYLEDTLIGADLGFDTVEAVLSVVEKHRKDGFIEKVEEVDGYSMIINKNYFSDNNFFNLNLFIHLFIKAISSRHAIFNPCLFSIEDTNALVL